MTRISILFWILAFWITLHAVSIASVPPFEPAWHNPPPPRAEFRNIRLQIPPTEGSAIVSAAIARPGYERLGPFSFGVPTHLELHDVDILVGKGELQRSFHSERARYTQENIELEGPVTCPEERATWRARSVLVTMRGNVYVVR